MNKIYKYIISILLIATIANSGTIYIYGNSLTRILGKGLTQIAGVFRNYQWDANGTVATVTDGAGTWTDPNQWWDGGTNRTWQDEFNALIGAGGTGGDITTGVVTVDNLTFTNFSGIYVLTNGTIAVNGTLSTSPNSGDIVIHTPINGNGSIIVNTSGKSLTLNNANTYIGGVTLNAGTLSITNDNALGSTSGNITFSGTSTLAIPTAEVLTFNKNRTISIANGITATFTSDNGAKTFDGLVTGSGTLNFPSTTSLILTNINNTFSGPITINTGGSTTYGFQIASLVDNSNTLSMNNGTLIWAGINGPKIFTNRVFAASGTTLGAYIVAQGATANDTITILQPLAITGTGNKTLTLAGTNVGTNTFGGVITNGTGSVISLSKTGVGTWAVTNNNTFSGSLSLGQAGILILTGINQFTNQVINNASTLVINTISNNGSVCSIGKGTTGLSINLGGNNGSGTLTYIGTGNSTDRQFIFGYSAAANTSSGNIYNNGTGPLTFTGNPFNLPFAGITATRVLAIGGSYSNIANEITGCIQDSVKGTGLIAISKDNDNSQWIFSGTNQYSGSTTISGGALFINSNGNNATNIINVNAGGQLSGTGVVYLVTVAAKGILQAGGTNGIGTLNISNNVTFAATATNLFNILSSSSYGSINQIGGRINLTNATLRIIDNTYIGTSNDIITLIATNSLANALTNVYTGLANGAIFTNGIGSSTNIYRITYTNNVKLTCLNPFIPLQASGGDIIGTFIATNGFMYKYHLFNNSGTFNLTNSGTASLLIVAGGGGGGGHSGTPQSGGGGGGGGVIYTNTTLLSGAYSVTVGGGGLGGTTLYTASQGTNSIFGSFTAIGGGYGGQNTYAAGNGGSGGGANGNNAIGTGTVGQGNNGYAGGGGKNGLSSGGGGGFANNGSAGSDDNNILDPAYGGNGSDGLLTYFNDGVSFPDKYYAGGGGGAGNAFRGGSRGAGGSGGGGYGSDNLSYPANGTDGLGGGGGGAWGAYGNGGNGGKGVVMVVYQYIPTNYIMPITFSGYTKGSSLNNFVALITLSNNINSSGFNYSQFKSAGNDFRLTSDVDGLTNLNYEIDNWNSNGTSYVWVQLPTLNGTSTKIYARWGNSGVSALSTNATWSSSYVGVWHMSQTNSIDSTTIANNFVSKGNTSVASTISTGQSYNGSSTYETAATKSNYEPASIVTAEAIVTPNWTSPAAYNPCIISIRDSANVRWSIHIQSDYSKIGMWNGTAYNTVNYTFVKGTTYHIAVKIGATSGASTEFFINGNSIGTIATGANSSITGKPLNLASSWNTGLEYMNGTLDEVRLYNTGISSDYIWASYNSQVSNTAFTTYGKVITP